MSIYDIVPSCFLFTFNRGFAKIENNMQKILKHLSEKEAIAIQEFKQKVKSRFSLVALKLFGSKARGDYNKYSDIDVLLVMKNPSSKEELEIHAIAVDILLKYEIDLSVKIFSEKEYKKLNSIPTIFMRFIQKEGVSFL